MYSDIFLKKHAELLLHLFAKHQGFKTKLFAKAFLNQFPTINQQVSLSTCQVEGFLQLPGSCHWLVTHFCWHPSCSWVPTFQNWSFPQPGKRKSFTCTILPDGQLWKAQEQWKRHSASAFVRRVEAASSQTRPRQAGYKNWVAKPWETTMHHQGVAFWGNKLCCLVKPNTVFIK